MEFHISNLYSSNHGHLKLRFAACCYALISTTSAVAEHTLYRGTAPPLPVSVADTIELAVPHDDRVLRLRTVYPEQGESYPLIVLSHGTFSSNERYDRVAKYWAGQGYVVILPQHIDANYGVKPSSYEVMEGVVRTRVADLSLVLDELDAIEQQLPALRGKIDRNRYIAAGHSIGTQVAMLVTGLKFKRSQGGPVTAADEDRFDALIMLSDPGKMRLMPADTWQGSNVPTFVVTGTEDYGLMGQRGAPTEAQSEILSSGENGAQVDRYFLLLDGGDHYFGGLIQKDVDAEPDHEGLAIFNATSMAFMDAYVKNDASAKTYLAEVDIEVTTNGRASLQRQ